MTLELITNHSVDLKSFHVLQTDLQTTSQRNALPSKLQEANAVLEPGKCLGEVITHEIKEIGQHMCVFLVVNLFGYQKIVEVFWMVRTNSNIYVINLAVQFYDFLNKSRISSISSTA